MEKDSPSKYERRGSKASQSCGAKHQCCLRQPERTVPKGQARRSRIRVQVCSANSAAVAAPALGESPVARRRYVRRYPLGLCAFVRVRAASIRLIVEKSMFQPSVC
ncbi:MAG: hypothetical protein AAF652_15055 [Cyanobacteria bacterium P01_C01_bin.72]